MSRAHHRTPSGRRLAAALGALLVAGAVLAACSHPKNLGTGAYDYPTTTTAGGSTTLPPPATTAPRTDWVPVVFDRARLLIPPSWEVDKLDSSTPCHPARQPGTIWVGEITGSCRLWRSNPGKAANLVIFGLRNVVGLGAELGSQQVDGYHADVYSFGPSHLFGQRWLKGTAAYYFPTLGVTVVFAGPLGVEVVETIHSAS